MTTPNTMTNQSITCPKWQSCNATVCPIDPGYRNYKTQKGEAVCLWFREAMKAGGMARIPAEIAPKVREALPVLLKDGGSVLRDKLNQAARSGSKIAHARTQCRPTAGIQGIQAASVPAAQQYAAGHSGGST